MHIKKKDRYQFYNALQALGIYAQKLLTQVENGGIIPEQEKDVVEDYIVDLQQKLDKLLRG